MNKMTFGEWIAVIVSLVIIFVFFGSFFTGNSGTSDSTPPSPTATSTESSANSLKIEDVKVGTGREAKNGDTISVHYVGTLTDGTKFDSSRDRKTPFDVTLGAHKVIKGWEAGLVGMKVGGVRKLTIPPELGYGADGFGKTIPPNATLMFEIELLSIK